MLHIQQIPVLSDNYVYLVHDEESAACAAVDPAEAEPVLAALREEGLTLSHILNTHHHGDHVGGNERLKVETGCAIVGPRADASRIPGIDVEVGEGDEFRLGNASARVFDVPGHTRGHIAYWFEGDKALFCGDTLFALGCGRLFEGTPREMWESLTSLRNLPGDTRVYCAHEYTQTNARFALTVEPDNEALKAVAERVEVRRAKNLPTVPSLMADEVAANPFLRADSPELQRAMGMENADAVDVFAEIRHRKDAF
ncbi:MAG: hydroxyacylglutathione hydrolase [Alphaproteobacteria bacterium]|nr:hydroxyacylglutathione hydrolase [Alphaproteobacteria bacterium]